MKRSNKRECDQLRQITIEKHYLSTNKNSVLVAFGRTRVLCAATTGNWVPPHVRNEPKGWISAQYSMLPNSSNIRIRRERQNVSGRTKEIERLIGRSLRSICDLRAIPEESIIVDCDVIEADGGTRTAALTGSVVALYLLFNSLIEKGKIRRSPIEELAAAVSIGVVYGESVLDLESSEDMSAQVDLNLVMTESGRLCEIQGTGEEATFSLKQLGDMIELGKKGIKDIIAIQRKTLGF